MRRFGRRTVIIIPGERQLGGLFEPLLAAAAVCPRHDRQEAKQPDDGDDGSEIVDVHGLPGAFHLDAHALEVGNQHVELGLALKLLAGAGDFFIGIGAQCILDVLDQFFRVIR